MIALDGATVLLQWATGGLFFAWVTTRRRQVSLGYGWLVRITYGLMGLTAAAVGLATGWLGGRDLAAIGLATAAFGALVVSIRLRSAGVSGHRAVRSRRRARVAEMLGRAAPTDEPPAREFEPALDLAAPVLGAAGLVVAAVHAADGAVALSIVRTFAGAAFLGAVSDAMLLGHWYLVQPGLARSPLVQLVRCSALMWPIEVAALLLPTGMISVFTGAVDDGFDGLLGWFWLASAVASLALILLAEAALRERRYAAVMAATGLLYLAILTAFGTDLMARAALSP